MMNKQHSNEIQSARKKLLAAVSMLLVACVMTISSTYAWFTLSTAPEVKGITTTVGANGNLEIALGTYDTVYGSLIPGSGEGDSIDAGKDVTEANTTWGNLIDLSDPTYGLEEITLYPARLNASETTIANVFSPLSFPKYGSDGRVIDLVDQTLLGTRVSSGGFMAKDKPDYAGVNAIGSASSMTPREFAVRNNLNAIASNRVNAVADAQYAINNYSGDLATLAIVNQESTGDEPIGSTSVETLNSLILKLEDANADIAKSIKAAMMLFIASQASGFDEGEWEGAVAALSSKTLSESLDYIEEQTGIDPTMVSDLSTPINKQKQIADALSAAKNALTNAGGDGVYTWSEIKDVVGALLNYDGILICGEKIKDIISSRGQGGADNAFNKVTQAGMNGALTFTFAAGSGIFADIADMTGSYTATLAFPDRDKDVSECEVEGITLDGLKRPVDVKSSSANAEAGELGIIYKELNKDEYKAPGATPGAQKGITDTYGYTVDLLFRTNAADSYLQLQTAAANRIYEKSDNEAIKGSGSNMTFTISNEYTKAKIDEIAEGIKVVFYKTGTKDGGTADILGVATLGNGVVTGNNYKLDLVLQNYNITSGVLNTTGAKTDDTATVMNESCALTALSANTIQKVTALVYLDGDVINNGNIGVAAKLNGQLNLQFSSSAKLDPMKNNDLFEGTTK